MIQQTTTRIRSSNIQSLTVRQRKRIYQKAYNSILRKNEDFLICDTIKEIMPKRIMFFVCNHFEELNEFMPLDRNIFSSFFLGWWDHKDKDSRLNALLLCIEMCNDELNK